MTELYIALTLWAVGLPFLFSIGINGIRYARILRLEWPIYVESAFWLLTAILSLIRFVYSAYVVLWMQVLPPDYNGIGYLPWIGLLIGLAFVIFMAAGKYTAVRNARKQDFAARSATAEMHNAIFQLQRKIR